MKHSSAARYEFRKVELVWYKSQVITMINMLIVIMISHAALPPSHAYKIVGYYNRVKMVIKTRHNFVLLFTNISEKVDLGKLKIFDLEI
jgi:hypothetical protein